MNIYVASSWRNEKQPAIVSLLREEGHKVYDFRDPRGDGADTGFHWSEIDANWKDWTPEVYRKMLESWQAVRGFTADFSAMLKADAFVLVMPCGRSAHLEAGWAVGHGKHTAILLSDGEPELMYKMADLLISEDELKRWVKIVQSNLNLRSQIS